MSDDFICYCTVGTSLGAIAIAWTPKGLLRLVLPARDRAATLRRLLRDLPDAVEAPPSPAIAPLVGKLRDYANGGNVDFSDIPLDLRAPDAFQHAIYDALAKVGYGETTSYGALAKEAGYPNAARETGAALGHNPVPLVLPCHRVLTALGGLGGFSAPGGVDTKRRLLLMERAISNEAEPAQTSFAF